MTKEVKEDISDIMELLETTSKKEFYRLTIDHELVVRLYNYITNLQKENERLKELYNEEIHKRIKAHKYIFKNMIYDALYPASKVDGENVLHI